MNAHSKPRAFTAALAVREHVPLLVGLMGPSGGGKTFSALRLATGIQQIAGGDIFMIDTEARRGLHYADRFRFKHVPFEAPFGSEAYLDALRFCADQGAGVIIVDSMSHEHEGPGGLLDFHETELDRMAGDSFSRREAMKMLAWGKPKAARRKLINGLLQMNCNFVFCFRAKNSVKPVKVNGKTEVVPQGFMPIAGEELVFEMTLNALLMPGANGVPTWRSDNVGEKLMMKLPEQFRDLMREPRPLDEAMGKALAAWARGDVKAARQFIDRPAPDDTDQRRPDDEPGNGLFTSSSAARAPEGEATNPSGGGLDEAANAYEVRLKMAGTVVKLDSVHTANIKLRERLKEAMPTRLADLDLLFSDRRAALTEAGALQ